MSNDLDFPRFSSSVKEENISDLRIHFVGAGGVGVCSLLRICKSFGATVSGSDRELNENVIALSKEGISITVGHKKENINGADIVVRSLAIKDDVPEIIGAKEKNIPVLSRPELLGILNLAYDKRIAVAGSHGKSTTVAMMEKILTLDGKQPTVLSGAELPCGSPTLVGKKDCMLYEACEYMDAFLHTHPTVAMITNIEMDHPDYFKNIEDIKGSFIKFINSATDLAVVNYDDKETASIIKKITAKAVTYGAFDGSDYKYNITGFDNAGYSFTVKRSDKEIGRFTLNVPGAFNISNAVCAIAASCELGISTAVINEAIASFAGIKRRLELLGYIKGSPVLYDYAHHPTEIANSILAIKEKYNTPLTVVFKPHTYSRTATLWEDFISALSLADRVILTDIYPAREAPIPNITAERLATSVGNKASYLSDDAVPYEISKAEGAVVLMGAGNLNKIIKKLALDKKMV